MLQTMRRYTILSLAVFTITALCVTLAVNAAPAAVITVTTTADNVLVDGECSLREAIQAANSDSAVDSCSAGANADTIAFAIPGPGPHTIQLESALPAISDAVTIDGYTQTGATPNTNPAPQALNTTLQIVLDGSTIDDPGVVAGLTITGGNSTVLGLVISNFSVGIDIDLVGDNTIAGNFIGTTVTGTIAAGNSGNGISIQSSSNIIGYEFNADPAARNLIAGNGTHGVSVVGADATTNRINGNLIGVDQSATAALGNGESGVSILEGAMFNTVNENVISSNGTWGILVENGASDTTIASNLIGTNAQGDALGNGADGILARNSGPQTVGGLYTDEGECCRGNTIAFNTGNGVAIRADLNASLEKGILSNRIYSNGKLGIDLRDDGVTLNDLGDADGENDANTLQNFPVLSAAHITNSNITITGTLNSLADTNYRIELFANDACDPSGYGEGQRFIGGERIETDADGNASFAMTFTGTVPSSAQVGNLITATASDAAGNTSEFSLCLEATGEQQTTPQSALFMPSLWGQGQEE